MNDLSGFENEFVQVYEFIHTCDGSSSGKR